MMRHKTARYALSGLLAAAAMMPGAAQAHLGHVGELAGHSHWVGVAAVAAAAALAAGLAIAGRRKGEKTADAEADAADKAADTAEDGAA